MDRSLQKKLVVICVIIIFGLAAAMFFYYGKGITEHWDVIFVILLMVMLFGTALLFLSDKMVITTVDSYNKLVKQNEDLQKENRTLTRKARDAVKVSALSDSLYALLTNMPAITFSKEVETGRYLAGNPMFADYANKRNSSQVVGLTDFELFDEETAKHFTETDRITRSRKKPYVYQEKVADAKGELKYLQTTKLLFRDAAGRECILGMSVDVTELVMTKIESAQNYEAYEKAKNESVRNFEAYERARNESVQNYEAYEKAKNESVRNFEAYEKAKSESVQNYEAYEKAKSESVQNYEAYERAKNEGVSYARIAALSGEIVCIYCVDPVTDHYTRFSSSDHPAPIPVPDEGPDFFGESLRRVKSLAHKDDLELIGKELSKEKVLEQIARRGMFTLDYRVIINGHPNYVNLRATMVTEDNDPVLIIGLFDVDDRVRHEQEYISNLQKMKDEGSRLLDISEKAEAANKEKAAFLSKVSHEIRTPINAVMGLNEMILRECDDENILGYSESIRDAGNKLVSLVNEIMDFSKSTGTPVRRNIKAPGARILAVDDNKMNLVVFAGLLKKSGMKIDTAISGDEAVALCRENRYDVIFLDHMMPEKDGIETLHELREDSESQNLSVPVICLTANAVSGAREQYISEGFDDYLTKPVIPEELEEMLYTYLPKEKLEDGSDGEKPETEEGIPEELKGLEGHKEIDIKMGLKNSGGVAGYMRLLALFYNSCEEESEELDRFLKNGDMKNYTIKIHALKSSAKIIGAARLSKKAQKLEDAGKAGDEGYIRKHSGEFIKDFKKVGAILSQVLESEADGEKPEADDKILRKTYGDIRAAAEDMDSSALFAIFRDMEKYTIPEGEKTLWGQLREALDMYDFEKLESLVAAKES